MCEPKCAAWLLQLRVGHPFPHQQTSQRLRLLACPAVLQSLVSPSSPCLPLSVPRDRTGSSSRQSPLCGGPRVTGRAGCWCCRATRWGQGGARQGATSRRDTLQLPTLRPANLQGSGGGLPAPADSSGQLPPLPVQSRPRLPSGRRQGLCARAALIGVAGQQQQQLLLLEQAASCQSRMALVLQPPLVLGAALAGDGGGRLLPLLTLLLGRLLWLGAALGLLLPLTSCLMCPAPSGGHRNIFLQLLLLLMHLSNRGKRGVLWALSSLRERGSLLQVADAE